MMISLSKLSARVLRQGLFLPGHYGITESNQPNPINLRIFEMTSWKEFINLLQNEKQKFSPEVLAQTSRHIINLAAKNKRIDYKEIYSIINIFMNVQIENLQPKNIVSTLALFRTFSNRGYNISKKAVFMDKLFNSFCESLKNKGKEMELSTLIFGYFQMIYYQQRKAITLASQLIYGHINKNYTNYNIFSISQISLLIHCLKEKGDLSFHEVIICKYLLSCVVEKLEIMKLKDVVAFLSHIAFIDTLDMNLKDFGDIKLIGSFVFQRLDQMEDKSVYDFLREDFYPPHPIYRQITKEMVKNTFDQINQNGTSQIDHPSLMKFLSYVSNRIYFSQYSETQKTKYYNFIEKYAKEEVANGDQNIQDSFYFELIHLVNNGHWELSRLDQLNSIIKIIGINPNLVLLEALISQKMNITPYLNILFDVPIEKLTIARLFKVAIMTDTLSKDSQYLHYKEKFQIFNHSVNTRVASSFSDPEQFNNFMRDIRLQPKEFRELKAIDTVYKELFDQLPNPFTEEPINIFYLNNYLSYLFSTRSNKEIIEFANSHKEAFSNKLLSIFINFHLQTNPRKIEPSLALVNIVNHRLESLLLDEKDTTPVHRIFDLLSVYNRFVVYNTFRSGSIFKLIHRLLDNSEQLVKKKLNGRLQVIIKKYISRNNKNYWNEYAYRGIIDHCLRKISFFSNYNTIQSILQNALRLGLLTPKIVQESVKEPKYYFILNTQLNYLLDPSFVPKLNTLNNTNFIIVCSNKNLGEVLLEKKSMVLELISKMYSHQICTYITNWNHPHKGSFHVFLQAMLRRLVDHKHRLENCNLVGVIDQLLKNNSYHFNECKNLAELIVEMAHQKMNHFSPETHSKFVQFISTQPVIKIHQYLADLLKHVQMNFAPDQFSELLLSLFYTDYTLTSQELKQLPHVFKKIPNQTASIFLCHQDRCRKDLKEKMFALMTQSIEKGTLSLSELALNYLKRHYPAETQKWKPPANKAYYPTYAICKPPLFHLELLKTIAKENGFNQQIEVKLPDNQLGYLLGDKLLLFSTLRFNNAIHLHRFIQKAMKQYLTEQNIKVSKVILLRKTPTITSFIQLLSKDLKEIMSKDLVSKLEASITKKSKEKYEQE